MNDEFLWQRIVVALSGLVYWGGVLVQARRVRKKIGRTPNLKPKGTKERLLWVGWTTVVLCWILQPLWVRVTGSWDGVPAALVGPAAWGAGVILIVVGYASTLWCYAAMGAAWRIGIDQKGTSKLVQSGPYRRIRHPIYGFQMTMLIGAALLLPTWISFAILVIHYVCATIKASDEEKHLTGVFGSEYRDYMKRTGRFLPGRG
ncbi:MAG: isoprenylcysteine carboxylmethyltransferase family protein [Verrucomicrobiales bacterium]|nr:isoprenylcysteine carboxylmethyltransferase family protein [Verrucomicrobiales bacterium]